MIRPRFALDVGTKLLWAICFCLTGEYQSLSWERKGNVFENNNKIDLHLK